MCSSDLAGVTFHQDHVRLLRYNERVFLRREPSNRYDQNAIRVENADGHHLGYIPKEIAADMAPLIDRTGVIPQVRVAALNYFRKQRARFTGVEIEIELTSSTDPTMTDITIEDWIFLPKDKRPPVTYNFLPVTSIKRDNDPVFKDVERWIIVCGTVTIRGKKAKTLLNIRKEE